MLLMITKTSHKELEAGKDRAQCQNHPGVGKSSLYLLPTTYTKRDSNKPNQEGVRTEWAGRRAEEEPVGGG